ncbi:MAG: class I SAM-dependent methyltransferase [Rhodospirillales bacterium]
MRRRLIPCYDAFYGTALALIADARPSPTLRILDLGAGTGLLSAMLLEQFPAALLHLMDASAGMLEQARRRFAGHPAVSFALADMAAADLGGPWDAVASALAIHHLDDAAKQALFRRIRRALLPGGIFVNAEQVLGPAPQAEERYARIWHDEIRGLGAPEDEIARAAERMAHDRCAPVEDQLRWLREAGFADVDCSFKAWRFAVFSGRA